MKEDYIYQQAWKDEVKHLNRKLTRLLEEKLAELSKHQPGIIAIEVSVKDESYYAGFMGIGGSQYDILYYSIGDDADIGKIHYDNESAVWDWFDEKIENHENMSELSIKDIEKSWSIKVIPIEDAYERLTNHIV